MIDLKSKETHILLTAIVITIVLFLLLFEQESQVYMILRTLFGSIFLLFLPGYRLTKVFFENKEIDGLERLALSFALSISVIPLLVFYSNLAGIKISAVMVRGITTGVIICSILRKSYSSKKIDTQL